MCVCVCARLHLCSRVRCTGFNLTIRGDNRWDIIGFWSFLRRRRYFDFNYRRHASCNFCDLARCSGFLFDADGTPFDRVCSAAPRQIIGELCLGRWPVAIARFRGFQITAFVLVPFLEYLGFFRWLRVLGLLDYYVGWIETLRQQL